MNIVKLSISNSREGILTINDKFFTCISDQKINKGDVVLHPQYTKVINGDVRTFIIEDIQEERPSNGDWKDKPPSTFRRCVFKKENISGKTMKELGYLQTEMVKDDKGIIQEKTYITW